MTDPAVEAFLVLVSAPILIFRAGVVKADQPVRIQPFTAELAVEHVDECIVRRLARLRKVDGGAVRVGPEIKITGDRLAAPST